MANIIFTEDGDKDVAIMNFIVVVILNPYEFGSTLAAAVPGSEDLHFDCDWLRDSSWAQPSQWEFSIYC